MNTPKNEVCGAFDQIARDKLPERWQDADGVRFADMVASWSARRSSDPRRPPVRSDAQIRLETHDGYVPHPNDFEVRAWRTAGTWTVFARARPITGRWKPWKLVNLTTREAASLNQTVDGPCLNRSVRYLPSAVPLVQGRWSLSFDGPVTLLDVSASGRRWTGMQVSRRLGPPGEIRGILMEAAFGEPRYLDRDALSPGIIRDDPN